jgi:hypothetical protein
MEQRHDWACMSFTMELFKYVFNILIPEVISHSQEQDVEQVRSHYDHACCALHLMVLFPTIL